MNLKKRNKVGEINVTPLVDVMLVLLVIFMVVSPAIYHQVQVDVPKMTKSDGPLSQDKVKMIAINKDGNVSIDEKYIGGVSDCLLDKYVYNGDSVCIQADATITYQSVISILDKIKQIGCQKVQLVVSN